MSRTITTSVALGLGAFILLGLTGLITLHRDVLRRALLRPVDPRPLALFRVALAAFLMRRSSMPRSRCALSSGEMISPTAKRLPITIAIGKTSTLPPSIADSHAAPPPHRFPVPLARAGSEHS